jgi:mono/diheme cytochrome c family protein
VRSAAKRKLLLAAAVLTALALLAAATPSATAPAPGLIERGRYLTHDVAMCVQCHSPRDEKGEIRRREEFRGASIPFTSPFATRQWAVWAPNLVGLDGFSDETAARLLVEGIDHTGAPPDPPMPPFRMTAEDAKAIIAYLRSLK